MQLDFTNTLIGTLVMRVNVFDFRKREFTSPSYSHFVWTEDLVMTAECSTCPEPVYDNLCNCGLYAATQRELLLRYAYKEYTVVVLCETGGKVRMHRKGCRAQQMTIRALVKNPQANDTYYKLQSKIMSTWLIAITTAADKYDLPVLEYEVAETAMHLWNIHLYPDWRKWYGPSSAPAFMEYSDKEIEEMIEPFGGFRKEEVSWEMLLQPQAQPPPF